MGWTGRKSRDEDQLGHYPTQVIISERTGHGIWNAEEVIYGIGDSHGRAEVEQGMSWTISCRREPKRTSRLMGEGGRSC